MGFFAKLEASSDLVHGMADRLSVDLAATLIADPEAEARQFRSAVLRCRACLFQSECRSLQGSVTQLDGAPSYCRNTQHFQRCVKM